MEEQHQRAQLQKRKRLISPSQRGGNGSVCSSRFQPLYVSLGNTSLLTADPGSVCSSRAMPGNLCTDVENLRVHNKRRTRTPTRKKLLNHSPGVHSWGSLWKQTLRDAPVFSPVYDPEASAQQGTAVLAGHGPEQPSFCAPGQRMGWQFCKPLASCRSNIPTQSCHQWLQTAVLQGDTALCNDQGLCWLTFFNISFNPRMMQASVISCPLNSLLLYLLQPPPGLRSLCFIIPDVICKIAFLFS